MNVDNTNAESTAVEALKTEALNTEFLKQLGHLRFITCGSVDDGKSTLIGRLLYDSQAVLTDHISAIQSSKHKRTLGEVLDLALLTDGLEAEREQGITIDVAYRYFASAKRRYIIADCPGHEQYTRNMVTGASTADAAILLVDITHAGNGLLPQTRRHATILKHLGVRHIVVAVNKMDLVNYSESEFLRVQGLLKALFIELSLHETASVNIIPVSALTGDNIVFANESAMSWYLGSNTEGGRDTGKSVLQILDTLNTETVYETASFRLPVQWIIRNDGNSGNYGNSADDTRAVAGNIASGTVSVGDSLRVLPGGATAMVSHIVAQGNIVQTAQAGKAISIEFSSDIDISRGDVLVNEADSTAALKNSFTATLAWMDNAPLQPARKYWLKLGSKTVYAKVQAIDYKIDINTNENTPLMEGETLNMNDLACVRIVAQSPIALDTYAENREMGRFILIDSATNQTVAGGMVMAI